MPVAAGQAGADSAQHNDEEQEQGMEQQTETGIETRVEATGTTSVGDAVLHLPDGRAFLALVTKASQDPELAFGIWNSLNARGQVALKDKIARNSSGRELADAFNTSIAAMTAAPMNFELNTLTSADPSTIYHCWLSSPQTFQAMIEAAPAGQARTIRERLHAGQRNAAAEAMEAVAAQHALNAEQKKTLMKAGVAIAGVGAGVLFAGGAIPIVVAGGTIVVGAALLNKFANTHYDPVGAAGRVIKVIGRGAAIARERVTSRREDADMERDFKDVGITRAPGSGKGMSYSA